MARRKLHPIGQRFQRVTVPIVMSSPSGGSWSTNRARVKIFFVVADPARKFMCRYYWEEGDMGTWSDPQWQMKVLDADTDETAPTRLKSEVIGVAGGGFVAMELDPLSTLDIDTVAANGRARANAGIATSGPHAFTVYWHDIRDVDDTSPRFKLLFRGSPPADLVSPGHERLAFPGRTEAEIQPLHVVDPAILTGPGSYRG